MEGFQFENELTELYQEAEEKEGDSGLKFIDLAQVKQLAGQKLYVSLNVKDLLATLDLKKEVVLTMLNQLEKLDSTKSFFRVDSVLPNSIQMRFHTKSLDELANGNNKFYQAYRSIATNR